MSFEKMAATLRLTKIEQELLRQKAIEINKLLIKKGRQPVRDSELAHKIIAEAIPKLEVSPEGDIVME